MIKSTQTDVRNLIKKNREKYFPRKNVQTKMIYVISNRSLTKGAVKYISENRKILGYRLIPYIED